MNIFVSKLEKNEKFREYAENIKNNIGPINLSGLSDVGKMHIVAGTIKDARETSLIVTYNELQAKKLIQDLQFFLGEDEVVFFHKKEISPYDYETQSTELACQRIDALNKIYNKKAKVVVTTIEALMQTMPEKDVLYKNIVSFKVGQTYSLPNYETKVKTGIEELKQILIYLGYERNDLVESSTQFSIRGGIVDIGLTEKIGVRIEFWGDEVDSIRYFNLSSQRSNEMIDEITIYPAHEYIISNMLKVEKTEDVEEVLAYPKSIANICKSIEEKYLNNQEQSENNAKIIKENIEQIKNGDYTSKIDKYFNEFYISQVNLLSYLPENYILFFDEMSKINVRRENIVIENNNLIKSLTEKERFVPEAIANISDGEFAKKNWITEIQKNENCEIVYMQTNGAYSNVNKYEFNYREINIYKSEMDILFEDILKWINEKKQVIILAGNKANEDKIIKILNEKEIPFNILNKSSKLTDSIKCGLYSSEDIKSSLTTGFESYDLKMIVLSMQEAFEAEPKKKKANATFKQGEKIVFADLKPGDFVVHRMHGIGQFVGVNTITSENVTKDYIKIKYKNDDMLYVPTSNLDNVRKYIGGGDTSSPKLNKLGTKEWDVTKERVKKNLREVAKDLIELYAKRQKIKGYAFSKDTEWQHQFEDSFPYQETDDQLRCIEEVKKDMELSKPMDRLLCGDVGYGKTEVAIRAAFKAVMDHKQVAYLVPTTVLANQQYEGFKERMSDFAINVEVLNRFRTKKQQDEIVRKLKLGEIDVVVGTHRILSNDVEFKDLGLLIIDEEHRFGVKDKEKIKKLKNSVDVLTMTATPIPRTLHMSILGIRDMSVIYEPPQNRRPVQTYVLEYDREVIKEAITKELERNGQVFYLYNKVEDIEKKSLEIDELVPEAKVEYAHGKMSGKQLEEIMERFINKEVNVLVCTTILESGIDIPNANTIIVENADRLGLAQLYQIRGRVGRSNKQAYAYVTYKSDKLLTEVADKRLKTIKEFTEFGSGFKIAMRDLEIRGAGSLLGEIQHGHMEQVGYDTYCKLLDEVVKEMQGIEVKEEQDVQVDINISSYIPDSYIDSGSQKIEVYQNIALCRTEDDIQNVIDELVDRYGNPPKEIENLLEVTRIKELARNANVVKISQRASNVVFYFDRSKYNPDIIDKLVKKYEFNVKFGAGIEPYVTLKVNNETDKKLIETIKEFLIFVSEKGEE